MKRIKSLTSIIVAFCMAISMSLVASADTAKVKITLDNLPAYSDSAYVELNYNKPKFKTSEKTNKKAFEKYSELDDLGRCGVAFANVCKELMPTEERGYDIKKENIGLIEVMGLAVLPARLAKEINMLETAMLNGENLNAYPELIQHAQWAEDILKRHPDFNKDNAKSIIEDEIGKVFLEVLEDAGVFKRNENGQKAFKEFITSINE